jgi:hypothetical protein
MAFMFPFHELSTYQFEHPDEPLVLPDDVLSVIRGLSKPVFEHFQDYKAYVRIFGKEYPELKAKLMANDEATVVALRAYLDAKQYLEQSGANYKEHMSRPRPDNVADLIEYRVMQEALHEENRYDAWWSCNCHRSLQSRVRETVFEFWDFEDRLYEEDDDDYSLQRWERTANGWEPTSIGW